MKTGDSMKTYTQLITEAKSAASKPAKINAADFDPRAANDIENLNAGLDADGIIKIRLSEGKDTLNRLLEKEYDTWRKQYFLSQDDSIRVPLEDLYYSHPALHSLNSYRKKIAAVKSTNKIVVDALKQISVIVDKYQPAADVVEYLKGKIVKKESKAETKAKERAAIPMTKVSQVVGDAVRAQKPDIIDDFMVYVKNRYKNFADRYGDGKIIPYNDLSKALRNEKMPVRNAVYGFLRLCTTDVRDKAGDYSYKYDKSKALTSADRYADDTINQVIGKIMDKAGDLQKPVVKDLSGARFIVSGEVDGKQVQLEQSIKLVQNQYGTVFNQFPCLIYVDGKFMSEAKYKTWLNSLK